MDSTSTSPFVATSLYTAKYGAVGTVGKKIFFPPQTSKLNHWPSRSAKWSVPQLIVDLNMPSKAWKFIHPPGTVFKCEWCRRGINK